MINPEKPLLGDKTNSLIVSPDGTAANYPTVLLSMEDAKLLREYKKFLLRMGLKEAVYCNSCYERNLSHGTEFFVTSDQIMIKCRCQVRFYQGQTL